MSGKHLENKFSFVNDVNGVTQSVVIYLTRGQQTEVDFVDWLRPEIQNIKWNVTIDGGKYGYYASGRKGKKKILLHRLILNAPSTFLVDHIDHNTLDNRNQNLRLCNFKDNSRNQRKPKSNTSGFKGVSWHKATNKWRSTITKDNKSIHLGCYSTKEKAYEIYCKKAKELFGDFASFEKGE